MIAIPQKIVCVGLNYRDHAEEQGVDLPERPLLFAKWPNTLIASGEPIRIPAICKNPDYEAELGVVIGRRASGVAVDDALDFVRGYVVANDVSARDLQFSDGQWVRGKSLDSFLPVSDLVPAADVPDPQALPIRAILNGKVLQDSSTSNMIFGVAEIVSFVSQAITLVPDLHVVVVLENRIVELVPEGLDAVAPLVRDEHRPVTFVSGPSATSDIELDRVEGVHGPRNLVVVVAADRVGSKP
jgi:hypothetical protein